MRYLRLGDGLPPARATTEDVTLGDVTIAAGVLSRARGSGRLTIRLRP